MAKLRSKFIVVSGAADRAPIAIRTKCINTISAHDDEDFRNDRGDLVKPTAIRLDDGGMVLCLETVSQVLQEIDEAEHG